MRESCLGWEKVNWGVSKPEGFPFFSGKVRVVSQTPSGLFLVGAFHRPRKRKRTNQEDPRTDRGNPGKRQQRTKKTDKEGRTKREGQKNGQKRKHKKGRTKGRTKREGQKGRTKKKDKKGRRKKDRETPPFEPPPPPSTGP